jgi:AcrR family transcriptional regulator
MAADTRGVIFTAAEKLFSENGYRDVSVEDVARAAGLGTGSFYGYFGSKEELYSEIIDALEKKGSEEAERHVRMFNSPMNQLKALYLFSVLALKGNPIIRGLFTRDRRYLYPGAEERSARENPLLDRIEQLLDGILREGTRKRVFRTDLFQDPRGMLIAVFNSMLVDPDEKSVTRLMNDLLLLIRRGLGRRLRLRRRDERLDRRLMRS